MEHPSEICSFDGGGGLGRCLSSRYTVRPAVESGQSADRRSKVGANQKYV